MLAKFAESRNDESSNHGRRPRLFQGLETVPSMGSDSHRTKQSCECSSCMECWSDGALEYWLPRAARSPFIRWLRRQNTRVASCGREFQLPRHPHQTRHAQTREQELPPTRTAAARSGRSVRQVHLLRVCRLLQYSTTPVLRVAFLPVAATHHSQSHSPRLG